jgi:glycosyltransferase involved in cell wall biosynthesis
MYKDKTIAIVVPAHNEETQIEMVVDTLPDFVDVVVIIDDCSSDNTISVIEGLACKNAEKVVLLKHEENQGVGGAIASGYEYVRDAELDIAVVMAGDGQMDPADLPAIIDPVANGDADYSKGNRLVYGDAYNMIPKVRYFGNSILSLLTKVASGYWHISDSQTGYTAINREALGRIDWQKMYKRYGQPNDLLVRLNVENFRVRDVPIKPVYNVGEKSGINVKKAVFTIGWLLVKKFAWRLKEKYVIRDFHPLVLFYILGFILITLSSVFFLNVVRLWISTGSAPVLSTISFLFSGGIGLQTLFFAMWFDMELNKDLR